MDIYRNTRAGDSKVIKTISDLVRTLHDDFFFRQGKITYSSLLIKGGIFYMDERKSLEFLREMMMLIGISKLRIMKRIL